MNEVRAAIDRWRARGERVALATVVATPDLTSTTELTVTVTAPFTPVVGFYLNKAILHLQARAAVLTPAGQLAP